MCGLYGFIGFKPTSIPLVTFLSLGVENDTRGGHGCGIFCDGQIEYGPSNEKYFEAFYDQSEILKRIKKAQILIGHDRKASVGGISDEKLQPVCIYNQDNPQQIDFVLMHNGTILNHTELAQKYLSMDKATSDKLTDSQIMARIIAIHGFGVFSEYEGAGAFVIVDYRTPNREPSVFVFKGETKEYPSSKDATEERPLYYIRTNNGLWFSSTPNYLQILCFRKEACVYSFPTNKVVLINDGPKLRLVEEIDRSSRYQKKQYTPVYSAAISQSRGSWYDEYDDYDSCYPTAEQLIQHPQIVPAVQQISEIIPNAMASGTMECEHFKFIDSVTKVPMTGVYYVNDDGKYITKPQNGYPYILYLFDGIPVFGEDVLNKIIDFCTIQTECINFDEMLQYFPEVVYTFSLFPYYDPETKKFLQFRGTEKGILCQNNVIVPFGKQQYNTNFLFKDGEIERTHEVAKQNRSQFYQRYAKRCKKNHTNLIKYLML